MEKFTNWIAEQLKALLDWCLALFTGFLEWLLELVEWIPKSIWSALLDGLASILEALPVPDFMAQAGGFFGNLPTTVVYFLQFFAVAEGIGFILSALLLRFLLRRIPLIG
ncbi:hypothetical protein D3C78_1484260 [compost metagenome]